MERIEESELVLNEDGSIYHINLKPEHLADTVILVGDQGRVAKISKHFDVIEHQRENREFVTHTGRIGQKRLSVLSTGIGCDNIDIVLNELDALVNIDLDKRVIKKEKKSLNLIRLGTSGSLQKDIPVDSFMLSTHGMGFDGLMNYYSAGREVEDTNLTEAFIKHSNWNSDLPRPNIIPGSTELINLIKEGTHQGITATAGGFYGPQGRVLRLQPNVDGLNEILTSFSHQGQQITNFEMETSALYGLSAALGHKAATVCAIIANRLAKRYSKNHHVTVDKLIEHLIGKLVS
jgi:uridine phosphorylase